MKLTQSICELTSGGDDVLVITRGVTRKTEDGGDHVKIKIVEGYKVAETEISLERLIQLMQSAMQRG